MNVFTHAIADGLIPDNPAASTIAQKEKKKRKRHTQEGLKAIRDASPQRVCRTLCNRVWDYCCGSLPS